MKISLLSLVLIGSALTLPLQVIRADDTTTLNPTTPSTSGTTSDTGPCAGKHGWHKGKGKLFSKLDLSDAQKAQIKQIVATDKDPKERHAAIFAVLTPEQQAELKQFRGAHKHHGDTATTAPSATSGA
jgi:Spy/CpxP family protein refolding chaperone